MQKPILTKLKGAGAFWISQYLNDSWIQQACCISKINCDFQLKQIYNILHKNNISILQNILKCKPNINKKVFAVHISLGQFKQKVVTC